MDHLALLAVVCIWLSVSVTSEKSGVSEVKICEKSTQRLICTEKRKMQIIKALYGRSSMSGHCYDSHLKRQEFEESNTNRLCGNKALSTTKVKQLCDGKSICKLHADNSVFGDPCINETKYLELYYTCLSNPSEGMDYLFLCIVSHARHN